MDSLAAVGFAGFRIHSRTAAGQMIRTVCDPHQRFRLQTVAASLHCCTALLQLEKTLGVVVGFCGLDAVIAGGDVQVCPEHCHAVLALYTVLCSFYGDRTIHQLQVVLADDTVHAAACDSQAAAAVDRQFILCKQGTGGNVAAVDLCIGVVRTVCQSVL